MKSKKKKEDHKINDATLEKAKDLNALEEEYLELYSHFGVEATNQPVIILEYPEFILLMEKRATARTNLYNAANIFLKNYCNDDMMLCKLYLRLAKILMEEKYEIAEMLKHNIVSWLTDKKFDQESIKVYVNTQPMTYKPL